MKKLFFLFLTVLFCVGGSAQAVIDPLLVEEMNRRNDEERIKVVVIMKSQYDWMELNNHAKGFDTRAERRSFVVNEQKAFAAATQYDLRQSLSGWEREGRVSAPTILWMANALYFDATKNVIQELACRDDIALIGYSLERNWIPDDEEAGMAFVAREITPHVTQVNADQTWALGYRGAGVVVAVVDAGVNYNHVDLANHLWDGGEEFPHHGYDVYNHDDDPMDGHGHGSHCAGIVCGDGTAGSQTGIAPEATLMCVKCLSTTGHGGAANIAEGIQWAVEHGCDLISMSVGIRLIDSSTTELTLLRRISVATMDAGIVAAFAAGNEGGQLNECPIPFNVRMPGCCPPPYMDDFQEENPGELSCSVCVGAVDYNDNAAYFTSRGPATWSNTEFGDYPYNPGIGLIRPDVCAPGMDIKSLDFQTNDGYTNKSGTSMSAPCVAGCMALMLSKDINLNPAEICRILEETAVPLAEGKSNIYGFGRVDALAAVTAIPNGVIRYYDYAINDSLGDHKLNPGESVTMSLVLNNISDEPTGGVSVVLTTENDHIVISQNTVVFPDFAAHDTITMEDAFTFSVDDKVLPNQKIKFFLEVYDEGELMGIYRFSVPIYDYLLGFVSVTVLDGPDGDGFLNPGETANLCVLIDNSSNEMAQTLMGTLSTDCPMLVLNEQEKSFGTIGPGMMGYTDFSVTLDAAATDDIRLPFCLNLTDVNGKCTELRFNYKNACKLVFSLYDSFGDGWQDNYLQVDYSDGTPSEQMTLDDGNVAVFMRDPAFNSTMTISWHNGIWNQECSFEIAYEDGTVIFQNSGGFNGPLTFTINCLGNNEMPEFCEPIRNLEYETAVHQVNLSWEAPENGLPTTFEVYRGTVLVKNTTNCTVNDSVRDGVYNYCVYAVYDDCQSEYVCREVAVKTIPEIWFTDVHEGVMAIAWTDIEGAIAYNLYRDDELIAENLTLTTYIDTEMALNAQHCYKVASVFEESVSDLSGPACANYYSGMDEHGFEINIFPNPTSGMVTIQCHDMTRVDVYSVEGKLVKSVEIEGDVCQLDGLGNGVYVVRIMTREAFFMRKIVKW